MSTTNSAINNRIPNNKLLVDSTGSPIFNYEMSSRLKEEMIISTLRKLNFKPDVYTKMHSLKINCVIGILTEDMMNTRSISEFKQLMNMKLNDVENDLRRFISNLKRQVNEV